MTHEIPTPTPDELNAAVQQLRGSDRGTDAMIWLRTGLQKHGLCGLDCDNWHALATLVTASGRYGAGNILAALEKMRL